MLPLTLWSQHHPQPLASDKFSSFAAFCGRSQLTSLLGISQKQQNSREVLQLSRIKLLSVCARHSTIAVPQARELFCWNQQAPCLNTPNVQSSFMN